MTTFGIRETRSAQLAAAAGAACAASLAGKDMYFFSHFALLWGPHAVLLLVLVSIRARPATIAGASLAATTYLMAFSLWEHATQGNTNGLAWLGYFLSWPGGACSALAAALLVGRGRGWVQAACFCLGITLAGFALNQGLVCSTVLYCGW